MDRKNFRIAEWLAAQFTGTATDEDERELREWEGEDERRRRFVGRVLDRENFERNEKELAHYPSGEAWERVKVRLGAVGCGWPPDGDVAVDGAVCCRAGFVAGGRCRLVVAGNGRGGDGSPDALQDYGGRNGRAFDDGRR